MPHRLHKFGYYFKIVIMKRYLGLFLISCILLTLVLFSGCGTLAVQAPRNMFVSTGDYVPDVRTLGILQEKITIFAPLLIVDINKVHQRLYEALIDKAQILGADGVTNISFSWKPSPISYVSIFILMPVLDFYIEAVAIQKL